MRNWNIEEMTGYVPQTTFYTDLSIADRFGINAIKSTYASVMKNWSKNTVYVTEFCMALNWKVWEHYYDGNEKYALAYNDLYEKCDEWCRKHLKGEDLQYYYRTTD